MSFSNLSAGVQTGILVGGGLVLLVGGGLVARRIFKGRIVGAEIASYGDENLTRLYKETVARAEAAIKAGKPLAEIKLARMEDVVADTVRPLNQAMKMVNDAIAQLDLSNSEAVAAYIQLASNTAATLVSTKLIEARKAADAAKAPVQAPAAVAAAPEQIRVLTDGEAAISQEAIATITAETPATQPEVPAEQPATKPEVPTEKPAEKPAEAPAPEVGTVQTEAVSGKKLKQVATK